VKLLIAVGFLLGVSMLAQAIGLALGSLLHASLPLGAGLRQGDRVAGAVLGGVGVLVMVWFITPAFVNTNGWAARESRESAVVRFVDSVMGRPPNAVNALKRLVGDQQFDVFNSLKPNPDAGAPPPAGLAPAVNQRVIQSTVKVIGDACGKIQEGSGFAIQPDTIVTNAHVVAGERETRVETPKTPPGRGLRATVVYFDPNHDLAVLHVTNLNEAALTVAKIRTGQSGAVYGHPGGGPLTPAPAKVVQQVRAEGTDIYDRNRSVRNVFILAAELHPGDSGGALVDQTGNVVGVAFAIAPDKPTTAYALTDTELRAVFSHGNVAVSTGPCLAH
jgi:S1-C subfamily serine protease